MSRVCNVMLAFNTPEVVRGAMINFKETVDENEHIEKWCFDPGYPLPDKQQNQSLVKTLCESFGWRYVQIENQGVMENHNTAIHEYLKMSNGDYYVTFDPDVRMDKKGWIPAMIEALNSEENIVFCSSSMWFHSHDWMYKPPYNRKVWSLPSGVNVAKYDQLIAWASGMWKADFLITRPRKFMARNKWYGWSEHADYERMLHHGKTWIQVADYIDRHLGAPDKQYQEWKEKTAAGSVVVPFEEWVNGNR